MMGRVRILSMALGLFMAWSAAPLMAQAAGPGGLPGAPAGSMPVISVNTPVDDMPADMRRAYIVGIQEELTERGYRPGPVDGVMGPQTRSAIRAYQRDAGLPVNGVATKELLDHIKFVRPRVFPSDQAHSEPQRQQQPAQPTATREMVEDIQRQLARRGYYRGEIDGLVGPRTREAARQFRSDAGLPQSNQVDYGLYQALRDARSDIRTY